MKTKYLFLIIAMTSLLFITCNKEDDKGATTTPHEVTPWKAGMKLTYAFAVDDDTVMKLRDEVLDYGYEGFPVLMLVHKETLIHEEGWGSVFHPLRKERLDLILGLWAQEFDMPYVTVKEKAYVARHFLDYIVGNDLDVGIFVDLALEGHGLKLAPMLNMVSMAKEVGQDPNSYMYRMERGNIPVENVIEELRPTKQIISGICCILFINNVLKTDINLVDLFDNNTIVANAPENTMSFICKEDTVLAHYTWGDSIASRRYDLSYDAGIWEAKCHYHIELAYNASTDASDCNGQWIYTCNTIPTYCHVKGPDFIVDGGTTYYAPVNNGDPTNTVPEVAGQVRVTYGDCCCFRKHSVLNFHVDGALGYFEDTWDTGK
jgi:hypothetical protein